MKHLLKLLSKPTIKMKRTAPVHVNCSLVGVKDNILTGTKLRNYGTEELAKVMNTTRLVEICLTRCGVEEERITALSTALANNTYLNILRLNGNYGYFIHWSQMSLSALQTSKSDGNG